MSNQYLQAQSPDSIFKHLKSLGDICESSRSLKRKNKEKGIHFKLIQRYLEMCFSSDGGIYVELI